MILVHASLIPKRQNTSILTPQKRNRDVLKIPHKESLKKMRGYPSFKISFFQKSDVIWTLGHSPCSVLGLVYRNQEKHSWALLIPKHKSSIKLGNNLL